MPSPAALASPNNSAAAMPTSPRASIGGGGSSAGNAGGVARPPMMKRHSSQSSHGGSRYNVTSPGSAGEHHPLRHHVGAQRRHAKIVLPRNHSSGRNLAKMGRQAAKKELVQQPGVEAGAGAEDGRKHGRQRSHEGDTEIRLPGSLDRSMESPRPTIRRNMTASELPRNRSATKLKKNYSHGQLTRLQSGKNLPALGSAKAPPSPGLKGKKTRPKSAEAMPEKDLHTQEVELYQQQQEERERKTSAGGPKKVGFAVGSSGDTSEDDAPAMEGSGMQEDDWTDQSASASPYSTRQNTANNSRRPSVITTDKPPDRPASRSQYPGVTFHVPEARPPKEVKKKVQESEPEADGTPAASVEDEDEEEMPSPRSVTPAPATSQAPPQPSPKQDELPIASPPTQQPPKPQIRSPLHAAKEHPNPSTKRLVSSQLPAPALVSNVSAMDDVHSIRGSPTPSLRSARGITGNDGTLEHEDELISRFIRRPSSSTAATVGRGSRDNTGSMNTPKIGSLQNGTPEDEGTLHRNQKFYPYERGPVSPGSTISGSSGAATPAHGKSRIELRMLHDKALADREAAAERPPLVPHYVYDRRNESLKSYLNLNTLDGKGPFKGNIPLNLGPEIFEGRFKAVNTELKVVQKFRDPLTESVERMRQCPNTRLGRRAALQQSAAKLQAAAGGLKTSKSAISLPMRSRSVRGPSKLSTSASPPKVATPPKSAMGKGSAMQGQGGGGEGKKGAKRGVSFAGAVSVREPEMREVKGDEEDGGGRAAMGPDAIARMMWSGGN